MPPHVVRSIFLQALYHILHHPWNPCAVELCRAARAPGRWRCERPAGGRPPRRLQEYNEQSAGVTAAVTSAAQDVSAPVTATVGTAATKAHEVAGSAATAVTNAVAGVGTYVQHKGLQGLSGDLTDLVRRYPVPALLIGLGIGFVLGRSMGTRPTASGS
jgi:hypothetical protein